MSQTPELRIFRSNGGALHGLIKTLDQRQQQRRAGIAQLAEALGADQFHTWAHDGSFAGFTFTEEAKAKLDMSKWTVMQNGMLVPSFKGNNAFWNILNGLGRGEVREEVLNFFGLGPNLGTIDGCPVRGVWFVSVASGHLPAGWAMPESWEEVTAFAVMNEKLSWN